MFFNENLFGGGNNNSTNPSLTDSSVSERISSDLSSNVAELKSRFCLVPDKVIREFVIQQTGKRAALIYLLGLTDKNAINNNILQPLLQKSIAGEVVDGELPVTIGNIQWLEEWSKVDQPSIMEIAYDCGFNDSTYFTRQFTKVYGLSPKAYRLSR